jgi:hypothetical protein
MSSDPGDERPEIDDKTISEVVRKPTRTAGDLSEVAGGPAGITTENVARDLETAASKSRLSTDRDLLKELLDRVRRIERYGDEISELTERVRKIERRIASSPGLAERRPFRGCRACQSGVFGETKTTRHCARPCPLGKASFQ